MSLRPDQCVVCTAPLLEDAERRLGKRASRRYVCSVCEWAHGNVRLGREGRVVSFERIAEMNRMPRPLPLWVRTMLAHRHRAYAALRAVQEAQRAGATRIVGKVQSTRSVSNERSCATGLRPGAGDSGA